MPLIRAVTSLSDEWGSYLGVATGFFLQHGCPSLQTLKHSRANVDDDVDDCYQHSGKA